MGKIASFEEFRKKASQLSEDDLEMTVPMETGHENGGDNGGEHQYYMFFKNLSAIKHYIEEIEQMDPDKLDLLLRDGHDWAADHIATSKDDIQEVAEWVRSEMDEMGDGQGMGGGSNTDQSPDNIMVDIEGDDDKVEIEDEKGDEEKEDSEEEDEEDEDEEE